MAQNGTKDRIAGAADQLFYERGFEATSFADIAASVGISRGNFYHHFKSKDEILDAVITRRMASTRIMLAKWQAQGGSPEGRIICFIRILIVNQAKITLYGCPVGTLVTELGKLDHAAQGQANAVFTLFRDWLGRQFEEMGCSNGADALAMHLLARSQGVATLAQAFRDPAFIISEVEQMQAWLHGLVPVEPN
ncbi:TetR/AcrR family transcriptional regulator [Leisingera methylohalidivorans]|uniref:Transcriptional regulator n=1 Tax=Leisingera methylohalidivorans DSM 14336 TaxID=999552 RepID=V9VQP0_9RHOB|nr:TetR/AcrR family transcriptional regulator [Leisingera methylohalidivorans]AHD00318.1 transcriptional regulator [Leisingera methylohalidivorans DSM 14336]